METSLGALAGLSLADTLQVALQNSGAAQTGVTALDAYHAIVDSYSTADLGRDPDAAHCDDCERCEGNADVGAHFGIGSAVLPRMIASGWRSR